MLKRINAFFRKALRWAFSIEREEWAPVLLATAYGFCILLSYYILRPVRDEISAEDRGNLQILWTVVFFVMVLAVPLYSSIVVSFFQGGLHPPGEPVLRPQPDPLFSSPSVPPPVGAALDRQGLLRMDQRLRPFCSDGVLGFRSRSIPES